MTFKLNKEGKQFKMNWENSDSLYHSDFVEFHFPEDCVLGERTLTIEIMLPDKDVIKLQDGDELITPVVFISSQNHADFLRTVMVKLPFKRVYPSLSGLNCIVTQRKQLEIEEKFVVIRAFSFSPVAVMKMVSFFKLI